MVLKILSSRKVKQIKKRLKLKKRASQVKKIIKKPVLSFLLVIIGFLLVTPLSLRFLNRFVFQIYLRNSKQFQSQDLFGPILISSDLLNIDSIVGDYPSRIIIPSLKLDLPIEPARIIGGVWEINENTVNFGIGSSLPVENGNTVLFAHARRNLFWPLKKIKKNDLISLKTRNGQWFSYNVVEIKTVKPNQVEVVNQTTGEKTLTLFTCTGFADLKRLIVIAKEKKG